VSRYQNTRQYKTSNSCHFTTLHGINKEIVNRWREARFNSMMNYLFISSSFIAFLPLFYPINFSLLKQWIKLHIYHSMTTTCVNTSKLLRSENNITYIQPGNMQSHKQSPVLACVFVCVRCIFALQIWLFLELSLSFCISSKSMYEQYAIFNDLPCSISWVRFQKERERSLQIPTPISMFIAFWRFKMSSTSSLFGLLTCLKLWSVETPKIIVSNAGRGSAFHIL
jgi:hypothetical protein